MKGKRPVHTSSRPSCTRILWAGFFPFLLAVAVSLSLLRRGDMGSAEDVVKRSSRGVLESQALPGCDGSQGCSNLPTVAVGSGPGEGEAAAAADRKEVPASTSDPPLEPLFLFIGILSGRGYRHRRLAVREAWASRAQIPGVVVSKFILSEDERTPQVQKELEMYNDIVFVKEKTNYKSILYKTFYVLEYGVKHYDVKFVLKTDDDAFINVIPMIDQLKTLCETPDCSKERLYLGKMAKHSEVLLQPGHKWNNAVFHNHTGLKVYPNYMMGGGYVMSGEVCRVLVDVHARMPLKFTPIEDATLGFWLMSMDLRHVDHPRFYTWAAPCCFKAPVRKQGQRIVTRFQLSETFENDLCSYDPWLVLHKIDSPTKMRYVGAKVANCSFDQYEGWVPPSIEKFVPKEKVMEFKARHPELSPTVEPDSNGDAAGEAAAATNAGTGKPAEGSSGNGGATVVQIIGHNPAPAAGGQQVVVVNAGAAAGGKQEQVPAAAAGGAAGGQQEVPAADAGGAAAGQQAQAAPVETAGAVPGQQAAAASDAAGQGASVLPAATAGDAATQAAAALPAATGGGEAASQAAEAVAAALPAGGADQAGINAAAALAAAAAGSTGGQGGSSAGDAAAQVSDAAAVAVATS